MATYRQYIGSYTVLTLSGNKQCDNYLRLETTTDIVKNCTVIEYYLDREGYSPSDEIKWRITVNGDKGSLWEESISNNEAVFLGRRTLDHNIDGYLGTVNIDFELWSDYSSLLYIWTFHESCTLSFAAADIDRSKPDVYITQTSADRFGKNASVSFRFEQWNDLSISTLAFMEAKIILKGLDQFQANNRTAQSLGTDSSSAAYAETVNGVAYYNLTAIKTSGLAQDAEYTFTLDSADSQDIAPLTSGKMYEFEISVTSENGNIGTVTGTLKIPQRITAFSCEEKIDIILGQEDSVDYSISPTNAQEQGVSFLSSDTEIAEIDEAGIITPISEGSCKITVIPYDDGAEPFSFTEHRGYYHTPNGEWIDAETVYSKSTGLIKVSDSDRFIYTGRGGDGVASVLWYDKYRTFISAAEYAGTIAGTAATVELYPPEGAEYVRFQSFGYALADVELSVVRYAYAEAFKGECIVTVALTQGFPELPENVQFLSAKLFSKINIAAEFVRDELTVLGATVEEFADSTIAGKNHPILKVREKLEATHSNCLKLKSAAEAQGRLPEGLSEKQSLEKANKNWYTLVNGWILLLNSIHNQINGG